MPTKSVHTPLGTLNLSEQGGKLVSASWSHDLFHESTPLLDKAAAEVEEYFAGNRREFSPIWQAAGTPFQKKVWEVMNTIPYGKTLTYGEVAERLGTAPRPVGGACGANPIPLLQPCHRITGAGGALTGYSGGMGTDTKALLLAFEAGNRSGAVPAHFDLWAPWRGNLPAKTFYVMRHGETDYNREMRLQGHIDIPLNATGKQQAKKAAPLLNSIKPARVVASPLQRAHDTARIAMAEAGLGQHLLSLHPGLKERSFGVNEGSLRTALPNWHYWSCAPEGEPWPLFIKRLLTTVAETLDGPGPVLLVAHGAVVRALDESLGQSKHTHIDNSTVLKFSPSEAGTHQPWLVEEITLTNKD